jgi:hypothetical protein
MDRLFVTGAIQHRTTVALHWGRTCPVVRTGEYHSRHRLIQSPKTFRTRNGCIRYEYVDQLWFATPPPTYANSRQCAAEANQVR